MSTLSYLLARLEALEKEKQEIVNLLATHNWTDSIKTTSSSMPSSSPDKSPASVKSSSSDKSSPGTKYNKKAYEKAKEKKWFCEICQVDCFAMRRKQHEQTIKHSKNAANTTKDRQIVVTEDSCEKAITADDVYRCCARTRFINEHFENGTLKVMRDDQNNLYGGRCSRAKLVGNYCAQHNKSLPCGIWDGIYGFKFNADFNRLAKDPKHKLKKSSVKTYKPVLEHPSGTFYDVCRENTNGQCNIKVTKQFNEPLETV